MTLNGQEARINAKQIEAKRFTSVASVLRGLEKLVEPSVRHELCRGFFGTRRPMLSLVSIPHPAFFTFSAYFPNEEKVLHAAISTQIAYGFWVAQVFCWLDIGGY